MGLALYEASQLAGAHVLGVHVVLVPGGQMVRELSAKCVACAVCELLVVYLSSMWYLTCVR